MSSISSEEELQGFYDSKPDAHLAQPPTLHQQHNVDSDCTQTKGLPPEIWSMIFSILEYEFRGATQSCLRWYAVTHVCRAWRNITLNDPLLWTDFVDPPPKAARELFTRSKDAPLILRLGSYPHHTDDTSFFCDYAVEHPERIRRLEIRRNGPFVNLLTKPAPLLESLLTTFDVEFPPDFLGGAAPQLKSVTCHGSLPLEASWLTNLTSLQCMKVYLEAPWLSNLTSLKFSSGWTDLGVGRLHVDMETILTALENMPLLQHLVLFPPYGVDTTPCKRSTPVHLRHLRNITVHFNFMVAMVTLFKHLRVDGIEKLEASWLSSSFVDPAVIETLCQFFATYYQGGDLYSWRQDGDLLALHRSFAEGNTPALTFRGYGPKSFAPFKTLLPRNMPRLLTVRLTAGSWRLRYPECDAIQELRIVSGYSSPVALKLPEIGVRASPPYPSLRRLHLELLSFEPKAKRIPLLRRWIARRHSKVELILQNCGLTAQDIEPLREVAHVVTM
ncbi:hypothetical protein CCMSSC00406_0009564 [Pleurotus cornucopiae]|uniref:Uncharacterized protein n=1 Tax=Pleurotus cornucopiae TaxID=5321 RepID=A0ACB7IV68_PLECO|nr:hypothetical protein CCMSSC00406_0009564 [Pleurotus cornucopiae]